MTHDTKRQRKAECPYCGKHIGTSYVGDGAGQLRPHRDEQGRKCTGSNLFGKLIGGDR